MTPSNDQPPARHLIAYADGVDSPRSAPAVVAAAAGLADPTDTEILLGWTPEHRDWLDDPGLRGTTTMAGYALAGPVAGGRLRYLPLRLSAVPRLLAARRPEVAVVTGIRRGGRLAFGASVGLGPAATQAATKVVVEVDEEAPDLGGPEIDGNVVAEIPRPRRPEPPPAPRGPDDIDLAIGRNVASVLPDDPTLQLGPGGVAEAIVASLDRPVAVWSGLVTDAMAGLLDRGLLKGDIIAAYAWGGATVARLAAADRLRLVPVSVTHDLTRLSAIDRFVGLNTALQVRLDGSVNVERVGGRVVAGIGGHADFAAGASRSPGGLSIIALHATARDGASTIAADLEVVSTPRCDVDLVVTEHGIADLRGVDDAERAERIIAVAAPEHRP